MVADESTLVKETSLRPAPDGAEILAFLTTAAPVQVVEQRDGWIRVRVDGWVPADAVAAEAPMSAPASRAPAAHASAPASPPSVPTAAPMTERSVEGLIRVKLGRFKKVSAAGVPVMLLPGDSAIGEAGADSETAQRLAELDERARQLKKQAEQAMRGSNFTEANRRHDELMDQHKAVLAERRDVLAAEHGRNEQSARLSALATAIADAKGWFGLPAVPAGSYKLYARLTNEKIDLEWIENVTVGSTPIQVDLDESGAHGLLPGSR